MIKLHNLVWIYWYDKTSKSVTELDHFPCNEQRIYLLWSLFTFLALEMIFFAVHEIAILCPIVDIQLEYWQSQEGPRRALWKFGVEMFKHYKSRSKFTVKGHVQGHTLKIYATVGKALSQGTHMPDMNVLYLRMKKLWPMLKIFKSRSKVMVKVTCSKFMVLLEGLVIRNTHAKYESPISQDKKVMPNNKVFQK